MSAMSLSPRRLDDALRESAHSGAVDDLSVILAQGADPVSICAALSAAAYNGHLECVKLLIPFYDSKADSSQALRHAAYSGHAECVKLLIPLSDPAADESYALRWAARKGRSECVKLLIPFCGRTARVAALLSAAETGCFECVSLLASSVSNPRDLCRALVNAARSGHAECVSLLLQSAKPSALKASHIFLNAAEAGQAQVAAAMLAYDPLLLSSESFPEILKSALAQGHLDLAALLSSAIDQRELALATGASKRPPLKAARL